MTLLGIYMYGIIAKPSTKVQHFGAAFEKTSFAPYSTRSNPLISAGLWQRKEGVCDVSERHDGFHGYDAALISLRGGLLLPTPVSR